MINWKKCSFVVNLYPSTRSKKKWMAVVYRFCPSPSTKREATKERIQKELYQLLRSAQKEGKSTESATIDRFLKRLTKQSFQGKKTVHFGQYGASDYTKHMNYERMQRYIDRHRRPGRENWTISGVGTAGFWSRWLLWSEPSFQGAIERIMKEFPNVFIIYQDVQYDSIRYFFY